MLSQALVAVMIAATPNGKLISEHASTRYSMDIARVADTKEEAAMLVLTANYEGSFDYSVEHCKIVGDHGQAITLYQMHKHNWGPYSREQLCGSNAIATAQAHSVMMMIFRIRKSWKEVIMGYGGFTTCKSKDCTRRVELFDSLMAIEEP
jgi:hypothetical protein